MALQDQAHHQPKTLAEGALCFACSAGLLLAAAVGLQWVLHLLP